MSTRKPLGEVDLFALIRSSQKSVFRVEALDDYLVSNEDIIANRYKSGESLFENPEPACTEWWALMEESRKRGVSNVRARPIPRKIPPYVRMEIEWGYNYATTHGEDVRVLIKEDNEDIKETWDDEYYLFDDKKLLYINYSKKGEFVGFEEETDPAKIQEKVEQKKLLLERTSPYGKFIALLRSHATSVEITQPNALESM